MFVQEVVQEEAERSSQRQLELTREADEFESAFFSMKRKHDEIKSELDKANQSLAEEQQKTVALKQSFDADLSNERKRSEEELELQSSKLVLMERERTDALNRATELEKRYLGNLIYFLVLLHVFNSILCSQMSGGRGQITVSASTE
jgi:uncharacterized coiled-coil DUF342 family protein